MKSPTLGTPHLICNHEFIEECVNVLDFIHQGSGLFKFFPRRLPLFPALPSKLTMLFKQRAPNTKSKFTQ